LVSRRSGIGEVVSSLTMLMVTISILGGLSFVSLETIRNASSVIAQGAQAQAQDAGLLLTLVSARSNVTGGYIWLYNYGWVTGRVTGVYLDGGQVVGWTSSCPALSPGSLCVVRVPPSSSTGNLSIVFGSRSIAVSL